MVQVRRSKVMAFPEGPPSHEQVVLTPLRQPEGEGLQPWGQGYTFQLSQPQSSQV